MEDDILVKQQIAVRVDGLHHFPGNLRQHLRIASANLQTVILGNTPDVVFVVSNEVVANLHLVGRPALHGDLALVRQATVDAVPLAAVVALGVGAPGDKLRHLPLKTEYRIAHDLLQRHVEEALGAGEIAPERQNQAGKAVAVAQKVQTHGMKYVLNFQNVSQKCVVFLALVLAQVVAVDALYLHISDEITNDPARCLADHGVGVERKFAKAKSVTDVFRHHR